MQKVLRHAKLVRRQVARREAVRTRKNNSDKRVLALRELREQNTLACQSIKAERKARREDWILGPLAPKRDVGEDADAYGALDARRTRSIDKAQWKDWAIAKGDRVVIVKEGHRDRGKIGRVLDVQEKAEHVLVEKLNMVRNARLLGVEKSPSRSRANIATF